MKEENVRGNTLLVIALIVLTLDQLTKIWAAGIDQSISLGFFSLRFVKNTGAAFGILQDAALLLGIFSVGIAISICIYVFYTAPQYIFPYALIVGGALGNAVDRLFRGAVIDFIDFGWWPVFNIADIAIVVGVGLLIIAESMQKKPTKPL